MTRPLHVDGLGFLRACSQEASHGLYLGDGPGGPAFAAPQHGVLVLGPPRSGKTSAVVVPNVLAANGPVVATSTKPDVLALTSPARGRVGPCLLFDPGGRVPAPAGVERVGWSPLAGSGTFERADLVAGAMVRAARPGAERGDAIHWNERAAALLAVAFHAGALGGLAFRDVVGIVDCREADDLRAPLARRDATRPLQVLRSITDSDSREQSGIWSTASSVLGCYRSEAALRSAEAVVVDAHGFVAGNGTLYVCAGSDEQHALAPVVAGLLRDLRSAAYERSAARSPLGAAGAAPLLFALDEVANIAPLHDLPSLVAEGGSQGVVTLACLQDLSQAAERWGQRQADGFLSTFGAKLVLPGIGDTRTLEALSLLAGDIDVPVRSVTRGPRLEHFLTGRSSRSQTISVRRERRLPVDAIAQGRPGAALVFEGVHPSLVAAVPWFASPELSAAVEGRAVDARVVDVRVVDRFSDRARARDPLARRGSGRGRGLGRG